MPNFKRVMMGAAGGGTGGEMLFITGEGNDGMTGGNSGGCFPSFVPLVFVMDEGQDFIDMNVYNSGVHVIRDDGTLWGAGRNSSGQIGDGTTTNRGPLTQVGAGTYWAKLGTSYRNTIHAIRTDGTLWGWGNNNNAPIGNGTTSGSYCSPVQIGSDTDWESCSTGSYNGLAIKTGGTLWTWGLNNTGACGLGNTTSPISEPTQVGALATWKWCKGNSNWCEGIADNGTLWTWGSAWGGAGGRGNTTDVSSPVQVGSLTDWNVPGSGGVSGPKNIKTDGTLWVAGYNGSYQLGTGNNTSYSSPVQIGSLTDWAWQSGDNHCAALKTSGTAWSWGTNNNGCLGLGDDTARSSPTQVGSDTDWFKVGSAGAEALYFMKSYD